MYSKNGIDFKAKCKKVIPVVIVQETLTLSLAVRGGDAQGALPEWSLETLSP
jgi:hypothetical protein